MTARVRNPLDHRNLERGPGPGGDAGRWAHWVLATDEDGIAWLLLDKADAAVNTLSEAVFRELQDALEAIETLKPKGLVIRSGKPSGFIAGADVGEFRGLRQRDEVEARVREAHVFADRLAGLGVPSVAVIHGYCLGGGLELALACRHRIAIEGARLGFPEILLGLHPGLGGTVRATHLIDPLQAMTMMLTGKSIPARKARSLGLVDVVTEERHVRNAVRAAVSGDLGRRRRSLKNSILASRPVRSLAARRMRRKAAEKAPPEHYPAPGHLIDLWERHGGDSKAMRKAETASFAELMVGDTAQNLIRVFFLRERLKANARSDETFAHIHVVGAGAMGGEIAAWCAINGLTVTLADREAAPIAQAISRAGDLAPKILHDRGAVRDALDRLIPDLKGAGLRRADLVIEAVPEKLDLKRQVYAGIEPQMKPGAILATNTSGIRLQALSEGLRDPGRFVGLHFFNPVSRMQLVEVVRHEGASASALEKAKAFARRIDRLPAPVWSAPGFLVNRALAPYLVEAMVMLDEGVAAETIDRAAEAFGMPMGPLELADQVGLDICLEVAEMLSSSLDRPLPEAPDWLRRKVDEGALGRKSGRGLYEWKDKKPRKKKNAPAPPPGMADRLILPMLNACVACLREGVVEDEDTLDAAMIFGTGFAPFRGGPIHYAKARGTPEIVEKLKALAGKHGQRFAPDEGWQSLGGDQALEREGTRATA